LDNNGSKVNMDHFKTRKSNSLFKFDIFAFLFID
jgi:hypothetical protein